MRRTFLVARREFRQQVRSLAFVLATFVLPVLLVGVWALSGAMGQGGRTVSPLEELAKAERPELPVGYIDRAGLIRSSPPALPDGLFLPFPDESVATTALQGGRIGAYYVIPADYRQGGEVKRISTRLPIIAGDCRLFEWMLVWNLMPGRSVEEVMRVQSPAGPGGLRFAPLGTPNQPTDRQRDPGFMPFVVALIVVMPLFMAGSYLLQGLGQEKENRAIELLLGSLRPLQLLAGKMIGLGLLAMVQFLVWFLVATLAGRVTGRDVGSLLSSVGISRGELALFAAFAAGGFLLYATLMASLGAIAPSAQSSRMWAFLIGSPMLVPIFLGSSIVASPDGKLAVVLSIAPFSSSVAVIMRLAATSVPLWEVVLSLALLAVSSLAMLFLTARIFRATVLLSGQPISIGRFWNAIRQP